MTTKRKNQRLGKRAPSAAPPDGKARVSRRGFLQGVGVASGATAAGRAAGAAPARKASYGPKKASVTLNVNGRDRLVSLEPRVTLLRALRNHLDLTGTKQICDHGACGGCSVLLEGKLVNACMVLALDAVGKRVTTVEGLADGDKLHPIQEELCRFDALQCGFCTPGVAMACKALLDAEKRPTLVQIKKGLSGNICRCGTYNRIFAAVDAAAKRA